MGKRRNPPESKPDMTPFSDMTFQLLIFFLVTLKFRTLEGRLDAALPKDFGTTNVATKEVEKVDIAIFVTNKGEEQQDSIFKKYKRYSGRTLRYEVGSNRFTDLDSLRKFLVTLNADETPITIDPRKETISEDVVRVLDLVVALKFKKVSFSGSFEEE